MLCGPLGFCLHNTNPEERIMSDFKSIVTERETPSAILNVGPCVAVSLDGTPGTATKEEHWGLMLFPFPIPQKQMSRPVKKHVIWTHRMAQKVGVGGKREECLGKLDLGESWVMHRPRANTRLITGGVKLLSPFYTIT